ncbi:hypothetical protein C1645_805625 [Glomus cerebriforme]|uniref:BTB domain-containing protein n=1 Tax=Glomus cerebriforme TaxID=658196 RepID=A0A397T6A8_9GLOM|nr:hypothetical protein C1645_805625 [Glomus cerebriforme]
MTLKFHSGLLKDISLMIDADDYNIIIKVGETQNTKEFHAHSNILRVCSQYFKNNIPADIIKMNNKFTINLPNITPDIFEIILKYIYTGKFYLRYTGTDDFKLLIASDFLLLEELVNYVQRCLIGMDYLVQQNFALVMNYIFNLPKYKKLQDYYLMSICENPLPVFTSNDFLSLDKGILFYLLKREDFQIRNIKEVVVWDSLIKWGINQIPELENKNNKDMWTEKNYEDLKNTLSDFIPLIKFININSDDFYDKVRPYEAIIPNNIYEEAMIYYLVKQPELYGHTQFESNY